MSWECAGGHPNQKVHREAVYHRYGVWPSMYAPEAEEDPREVHQQAMDCMRKEWWLYGRKAHHTRDKSCTKHYEGLWQPRRNGSLLDCTEEMANSHLGFTAFHLAFGTREGHERPATVSESATS